MDIKRVLEKEILVLDGAFATLATSLYQDQFKHPSDLLNLTHPQLVKAIHDAYVKAGADIIKTNTFNATRLSLDEVQAVSEAAALIAKSASPKLVAGVIGPTDHSASKIPGMKSIEFQKLIEVYQEQIMALKAHVDLFLIETIYDAQNALAALKSIKSVSELPVMVSVTLNSEGKLLSGETLEEFLKLIKPYSILSLGINCSFGPEKMAPYLELLSTQKDFFISAHPNAGLPNKLGLYQRKDHFSQTMEKYLNNNWIQIVGGCCGTTPEIIQELAMIVKKINSSAHP